MSKIVKPEWGDTSDVATLLHSTRRQVNKLAKNPSSGFPPAIDFGNCSRHDLASVLTWMEAKKPGNEAQLAELIKKRLDIDQKSAKGTDTLKSTPAPKQRATGTPTLSQVERRNDKILTLHQRSGQKIGWSMKTTCEGAKVKSYRLLSPSSAPWPKAMAKHTPLALPDFAPEPITPIEPNMPLNEPFSPIRAQSFDVFSSTKMEREQLIPGLISAAETTVILAAPDVQANVLVQLLTYCMCSGKPHARFA